MGEGMPGDVARGPGLTKFDEFLNANRDQLRNELLAATAPSAILTNDRGFDDEIRTHIEKHWTADDQAGSWFPDLLGEKKKEILQRGYVRAIEEAEFREKKSKKKTKIKIRSYWVCAGSPHFQVAVLSSADVGEEQITVLIMTPHSDPMRKFFREDPRDLALQEEIWIVGPRGALDGGIDEMETRRELDVKTFKDSTADERREADLIESGQSSRAVCSLRVRTNASGKK